VSHWFSAVFSPGRPRAVFVLSGTCHARGRALQTRSPCFARYLADRATGHLPPTKLTRPCSRVTTDHLSRGIHTR